MFAKSSDSLRKKVKFLKEKFGGEEEELESTASKWRNTISTTALASDGASELLPRVPHTPHQPTSSFIEDLFRAEHENASAGAGASSYVGHIIPRLRDSNFNLGNHEGDVLRASDSKGKSVRLKSPKNETPKPTTRKEEAKEPAKEPRKFNTWGRIKVLPSIRTDPFTDASTASGPGSVVEANTVFRKWPDEELALQRQVMENYAAGRKLWTREMLLEMEYRIAQDNPVRLEAYAGEDGEFEKQPGSDKPLSFIVFLSPHTAATDTLTRRSSKIAFMARFHGYQDLAHPPPSRPDGKPYCSISVQMKPIDHSREKVLKNGLDAFNHYMSFWLSHPLGRNFAALFMKVPLPVTIDKIVCFDLGGLTGKSAAAHGHVRRAIYKHAAVMSAVAAIHHRFGGRIRLLAQDPTYCSECVELLYSKGFGVVGERGARGLADVDERTLVFAPNPGFCLKEIIADVTEPAAMFWATVRSPEETESWTRSVEPLELDDGLASYYHEHEVNPDTPRVRELISKYTRHEIPTNNLFGAVSLYIRDKRPPQIHRSNFF
ncbi:hypothetical protein GGR53DRAFT_462402 [Hypoxylon sp. FL1150]|nr:hypothetical protein GGR53DRAFT_462402 [Hypoxylon sp. FL1150]